MLQIDAVPAMQAAAEAARAAGRRLALVPTMGALHEGHLALVRAARAAVGEDGHVTVSIFVNPTQFGPGEDFEAYPRTLEADLAALRALGGVDVVFAPTAAAMYPLGLPPLTRVHVGQLGETLCGTHRPGHFDGVALVVAKLFLACRPHVAVFGQKDAQQLAIIRRMEAELGFGIQIAAHPVVREADGLARSSRNRYLSAAERAQAPVLYEALRAAEAAVASGERDGAALRRLMHARIAEAPAARVQYAEIVHADTMQPAQHLAPGEYLAALAVYLGTTRLIDNQPIRVEAESGPRG